MACTHVAFGARGTWVIQWEDGHVSWSGDLPRKLYGLLNGRYENRGQHNAPLRMLSFNEEEHVACFDDGGWRSYSWMDDRLDEVEGEIDFVTMGEDGAYIIADQKSYLWGSLPARADQLLKTRNQYQLKWAALGYGGSYVLIFSDGAYYWGGCIN